MGTVSTNITFTFVTKILTFLLNAITIVVVARILGPEKQGIYTLLILLPNILVIFSTFGFNTSAIYFIGKKKQQLHEIVKILFFVSLVIGIIIFFSAYLTLRFVPLKIFANISFRLLRLSLLIYPLWLLFNNFSAILQGQEKFILYNVLFLLRAFLNLILTMTFLIIKRNVDSALYAYFFALLLSDIFLISKTFQKGIFQKLDMSLLKKLFVFGIKSYIANVASFLHYRIDQLIITYFLGHTALGYYSVAVNLGEKIWLISQSISIVILPRVSSSTSESDRGISLLWSKISFVVTFPICFILGISSRWIIPALFSEAYIQSIIPFTVLLVGVATFSFSRVLSVDLTGRGYPGINSFVSTIALLVNIILNLYFISLWGIVGVALATTISYTFQSILIIAYYKKITKRTLKEIVLISKSDIIKVWEKVHRMINKGGDK